MTSEGKYDSGAVAITAARALMTRETPMTRMRRAALSVVEFFLPRLCHVCLERLGPGDEILCDWCREDLTPPPAPVCPVCGVGRAELKKRGGCKACPREPGFDAARGAVVYNDTARAVVHGLKFEGHVELAPVMARLCWLALEEHWAFEEPDAIVPVPLHESRLRERGFNQSEEIGAELERLSGLPMAPEALERVRPTKAQSSLPRERRAENVRGAFHCDRKSGVQGKTILLVDDVMTTSATICECSRVLKEAGAEKALVLVFARAKGK